MREDWITTLLRLRIFWTSSLGKNNHIILNKKSNIKCPQVPCYSQQLDQLRDLLCVWISVSPRTFDFGEEQTSADLLTKG